MRFRNGVELRATVEFDPTTGSAKLSVSRLSERILALLDRADQGLARREIHARLGPGVSERQVRRGTRGVERQRLDRVHESRTVDTL